MNKCCSKSPKRALAAAAVATGIAAGVIAFLTQTKKGKKIASAGKKEILSLANQINQKIEGVANLTKEKYDQVVEEIVKEYAAKKKLTTQITQDLVRELKQSWGKLKKAPRK